MISAIVEWQEDEELFKEDFPPIFENSQITHEEYKDTLHHIAVEISAVESKRTLYRKYSKFGMLLLSSFSTMIVGILLWIAILLKLQVAVFIFIFFGAMTVMGVGFLALVWLANFIIERVVRRRFDALILLLKHESETKYEERGICLELVQRFEDYRMIPSIHITRVDRHVPWKKYPPIYL